MEEQKKAEKLNLKKVSASGLFFRFMERVLAQLVSTLVSIVLARILMPEEYGVISLITIFVTICYVFVSDGLSSSLIQKKDSDELDFSTIFWVSLILSLALYALLFFTSPLIAAYYDMPILSPVLRLVALRIPLSAFNSVQSAYVSKNFLFKKFFWATLTGTLVSGVVGIVMALQGFGVWALAAQVLTNPLIDTVFLFCTIKWRPKMMFSFARFKSLFSFGWKILVGGLITKTYEEVRGLIIAKEYSSASLSYYNKGKQFPGLLGNNISATISNVMFPVFCKIQDNREKMLYSVRRSMRVGAYLLSPVLIGFATISETFVHLVLTDKWLPCVPFIYIYCATFLLKPMKNISKNSVKALKRSDIDLAINVAEKVIGVALIVVCVFCFAGNPNGPLYLALSALVTYVIATIVNMIANGKLLGYSLIQQLRDTVPYFLLSAISCLPSGIIDYCWNPGNTLMDIVKLLIQIFATVGFFFLWSKVFKVKELPYILSVLNDYRKKGTKTA